MKLIEVPTIRIKSRLRPVNISDVRGIFKTSVLLNGGVRVRVTKIERIQFEHHFEWFANWLRDRKEFHA